MIFRLSITAFAKDSETRAAVEKLQSERQFARCHISLQTGGIDEVVGHLSANDTPNLLIVEVEQSGDALFSKLEALADVFDPNSRLIVIGHENDIQLYRRLVSMGINDYLCGPVSPEQLQVSINQLYVDPDEMNLGRVIACIGARGGAGSSSVAANLAYALVQKYLDEVILIDLDLSFGTAALTFNLQQRQSVADALAQPNRLDDVLIERFMMKYDDYLSVVAAPITLGENSQISIEAFEILLDLVRRMAAFIVLDLPHQWSPWIGEVLLDANEVLVTAYPDLANLRDTKSIFDNLREKRGVDAPTRLVFNKVGLAKGLELSGKDFEGPIRSEPAVSFPFESGVFGTALNNGQSVLEVNKRAKSARLFAELATIVSGRMPSGKERAKDFSELLTFLGSQISIEKWRSKLSAAKYRK